MATILTIIPYSFYPPVNGGALRCFYILREMARHHTVYVLTIQDRKDLDKNKEPYLPENVRIISAFNAENYRSFLNYILPARIADAVNFRILNRSARGPANTLFLKMYPLLIDLICKVNFDVIYFENLEALAFLGKVAAARSPLSLKLYDAHNVDSELWLQQAVSEQRAIYKEYLKNALSIERSLFKRVNAFFCCSEKDRVKLTKLNKNRIYGYTIPNGVSLEAKPYDNNKNKHQIKNIIFCGSLNYFPNKEGLYWFYANVYPILKKEEPTITLTVIGNMPNIADLEMMRKDSSVNLIGTVESVVPYYQQSSVALVPLLSGSGTRLKILEAMSMGNPIVSTTIGAEGLNYVRGEDLLIADQPEAFAENILFLLRDHNRFNAIRAHALEVVKKNYNWEGIGKLINMKLAELMDNNKHVCFTRQV